MVVMAAGCVNALFTSHKCRKNSELSVLILFKTLQIKF